MFPTESLFSRWNCLCCWWHCPRPGSEPQPPVMSRPSLSVILPATACDEPSVDSHLWETCTHSLGSAFALPAPLSLSAPQSRFLSLRGIWTTLWKRMFPFFAHPVASSYSGSGKLKPYDFWAQNFSMVFSKINFYWSIVALQCCATFYCIAKWISFTYTYIPSFLAFLPIWVTTECWRGFPELYIRFLLKFSILYIEVYICQSQSPNSSHPPPSYWCLYVYSLHPHLYFCFC